MQSQGLSGTLDGALLLQRMPWRSLCAAGAVSTAQHAEASQRPARSPARQLPPRCIFVAYRRLALCSTSQDRSSSCTPAGSPGKARALGLPAHPRRRGRLPGHLAAGPAAVEAGADRAAPGWARGAYCAGRACMRRPPQKAMQSSSDGLPVQADPAPVQQAGPREYTRVVAAGQLQHERSILVGPRPRSVMGTTQPGCARRAAVSLPCPSRAHACRGFSAVIKSHSVCKRHAAVYLYSCAKPSTCMHGLSAQGATECLHTCRYVLITPLVDGEWGSGVLVNRGWVPAAWKTDAALRARCQPAGQVCMHYLSVQGTEHHPTGVPACARA
jgi:hypothetical protein